MSVLRSLTVALAAGLLVAGCGSLPSAGPLTSDIRGEYKSGDVRPFELVDVSATTVEILKQRPDPSLSSSFGDYRPPVSLTIGIGDGVTLTIWEAGGEGLFATAPMIASASGISNPGSRGSVIPEQFVGEDGCITVPFAGRVPVAGKSTTEAQLEIERALSGKANKPQVLLHLSRNAANTVTVVGEVTGGARVPLSIRGDRLLDVLAAAGGIRAPVYEAQVQLTRGDNTVTVPLQRVLREPHENIYLRPGDDLIVTRQPRTFTAFGATGRNTQIPFEVAKLTLVDAVAKAGGLLDLRADPRGVFLFRFEPEALARGLAGSDAVLPSGTEVPVVYRLDMTKAGSYFLARNFQMLDGDMLYVSSAPANELQKFLQLIGLITQPAINGAVISNAVND